jgi:hypothetical protein
MDEFVRPPKRNRAEEKIKTPSPSAQEEVIDVSDQPEEDSSAVPESKKLLGAKGTPDSFKRKWLRAFHYRKTHLSRPKWLLLWACLLIALGGAGYGMYAIYKHYKSPSHHETAKTRVKPVVKPTTEASRLTGVQIDPALNKQPVTGIMIENSPDARPQSGLQSAGVVYEAIAEGGITRFLALYLEGQPDYIGPVRSVRPYYLDFLMPYDASVAHVGGAPQALSDIKTLGVRDLDQFANSGAYQRITTRYAPHNVYTSIANLNKLEAAKGYSTSTFTGFTRKKDAPSKTPNATSIDFAISSYLYNVHYDYDAPTNSYKRSEGGKPHTDEKSGVQLEPKVVVALAMGRGIDTDGQHTDYTATGSGHMYVFQDGMVQEGTWSKADRKSQFVFTDSNGAVLKLNAGQTWISVVDTGTVTSK